MDHKAPEEATTSFQLVNIAPVHVPPPPPPPLQPPMSSMGSAGVPAPAPVVITAPTVIPHFDVPVPNIQDMPGPAIVSSIPSQGTGTGATGDGQANAGTATGTHAGDEDTVNFEGVHVPATENVFLILDDSKTMNGVNQSPDQIAKEFSGKLPIRSIYRCRYWYGRILTGPTDGPLEDMNDVYNAAYYHMTTQQVNGQYPTAIIMASTWTQYTRSDDTQLNGSRTKWHRDPTQIYQRATQILIDKLRENHIKLYLLTFKDPPFPELLDYVHESGGQVVDASVKPAATNSPTPNPTP